MDIIKKTTIEVSIKLSPAVVSCLKRGLNTWQNEVFANEIRSILAFAEKQNCDKNTKNDANK